MDISPTQLFVNKVIMRHSHLSGNRSSHHFCLHPIHTPVVIATLSLLLCSCDRLPNLLTGTSEPPLGDLPTSPQPTDAPAQQPAPTPAPTSPSPIPGQIAIEDILRHAPAPPPAPLAAPSPAVTVPTVPIPQPTLAPQPSAPLVPSTPIRPPQPTYKTGLLPTRASGPLSGPVPLAGSQTKAFIDIRGVGDAGMANTYQQPLPPTFGQRLDALDRSGKSYRGDLSFINWETVVGLQCRSFRGRPSRSSYAFMSHPDNLLQAHQRGFNLIGLANNHSHDCPKATNGGNGALESAQYMEQLTRRSLNWLWHGVGPQKTIPQVRSMVFRAKGRSIKVAFGSLYMGGSCRYITCIQDQSRLLQAMRETDADLRILSIHSWNQSTQNQLAQTGRNFIRNYKGDIVFGHGPHVWAPVTVIPSNSGRKGVMFESLGNFIHPSLAAKRRDMIGRVLLDLNTLELRQVQAIPLQVQGASARFSGALAPTAIPTRNFTWTRIGSAAWRSGLQSITGAYANF